MLKTNAWQEEPTPIRHDWQLEEVMELFNTAWNDLLFQAQSIHRRYFNPNQVQLSTLFNIKTGACSEDCVYCSQSGHFNTGTKPQPLMAVETIVAAARQAQANGATRFCMGAAGRNPLQKEFSQLLTIVKAVKSLGLETCMTLGRLTVSQAQQLKAAGLDYYNHNLDTSATYYEQIVTTHSYQERLETLTHIRAAQLKVCCGGIIGLGETLVDRAALLQTLANLPHHPESVPINQLVPIAGTPLAHTPPLDPFDLVRCIAVARILMPTAWVRLSAGRTSMSDELQALCFFAGANAIFYGEKLLTTNNLPLEQDRQLLSRLRMQAI
jgi:biotin synthase